jgi:hypothetical protein
MNLFEEGPLETIIFARGPRPASGGVMGFGDRKGAAMGSEFMEQAIPEVFLSASFANLQAQVERLVGPLFERRSVKDRRESERDPFGRRESDRFSEPLEGQVS